MALLYRRASNVCPPPLAKGGEFAGVHIDMAEQMMAAVQQTQAQMQQGAFLNKTIGTGISNNSGSIYTYATTHAPSQGPL